MTILVSWLNCNKHVLWRVDYQIKFETLLSKTKGVFRDQLASYFINGLKENIRYSAQLKEPHTVHQAVSYAKKYEQWVESRKKNYQQRQEFASTYRGDFKNDFKTSHKQGSYLKTNQEKESSSKLNAIQKVLDIKQLTPSEIRDRRAKGLCFNCNEKYEVGHRCQWFFLIDCWNESELEQDIEEE